MITAQLPLDTALAGPPPEPCVNCEQEAAPRWLLCLTCAAALDEAMLMRLTTKYTALGDWLTQAQAALWDLPEGSEQFVSGWALWSRKQQVRQRLGWLWDAVKAAS